MTLNKKNLATLATYLEGLPVGYTHFDMSVYAASDRMTQSYEDDDDGDEQTEEYFNCSLSPRAFGDGANPLTECGSVACAVGHGPLAGIPVADEDFGCWTKYAERVFGASPFGADRPGAYMFGADRGGDHHDAAERIREVLAGKEF